MTLYSELPWEQRLSIMNAVEQAGSAFSQGYVRGGFQVAIGRGALGDTVKALEHFGFKLGEIVYFPLGSDHPPEHLRHDSIKYGVKSCMWCYAQFDPA